MSHYETTTYKGHILKSFIDESYYNPREWDDLATLWTVGNYSIDEMPSRSSDEPSLLLAILERICEDYPRGHAMKIELDRADNIDLRYSMSDRDYASKLLTTIKKYATIKKIYKYEHSAIAYSTSPFSCRWDSQNVGYAFMSKPKACKYYGAKRFTKKIAKLAEQYLDDVVSDYSDAINATYFYVRVEDSNGVDVDSEYASFTSYEDAIEATQKYIDTL